MALLNNDQAIVEAICGPPEMRDAALKSLFEDGALRRTVIQYALANGGDKDDGQDLFQDTVVLFDRSVRDGKFHAQSGLRTYFISIAKWHWLNMRRKKHNAHEPLPNIDLLDSIESPEVTVITDEQKAILQQAVEQLGGRCVKLLTLYKLSYSMEEIAQEMGLSSADMAKKEVYRCREKLRNYFKQHPDLLKSLR
jgi:RNA polymerase sigma factor (sigma-70 family)